MTIETNIEELLKERRAKHGSLKLRKAQSFMLTDLACEVILKQERLDRLQAFYDQVTKVYLDLRSKNPPTKVELEGDSCYECRLFKILDTALGGLITEEFLETKARSQM